MVCIFASGEGISSAMKYFSKFIPLSILKRMEDWLCRIQLPIKVYSKTKYGAFIELLQSLDGDISSR